MLKAMVMVYDVPGIYLFYIPGKAALFLSKS